MCFRSTMDSWVSLIEPSRVNRVWIFTFQSLLYENCYASPITAQFEQHSVLIPIEAIGYMQPFLKLKFVYYCVEGDPHFVLNVELFFTSSHYTSFQRIYCFVVRFFNTKIFLNSLAVYRVSTDSFSTRDLPYYKR